MILTPPPSLGDIWQILQEFLVVTIWRRGDTGSWWVEPGMLLNTMHRAVPTMENGQAPNVNSTNVEKLWAIPVVSPSGAVE